VTWRERVACAGKDPEIFFSDNANQAKRICARCPVQIECLEFALSVEGCDAYGVYGGLTNEERKNLRRGVA
jgi:WhiB family redox-sensing transcriptional regulator